MAIFKANIDFNVELCLERRMMGSEFIIRSDWASELLRQRVLRFSCIVELKRVRTTQYYQDHQAQQR